MAWRCCLAEFCKRLALSHDDLSCFVSQIQQVIAKLVRNLEFCISPNTASISVSLSPNSLKFGSNKAESSLINKFVSKFWHPLAFLERQRLFGRTGIKSGENLGFPLTYFKGHQRREQGRFGATPKPSVSRPPKPTEYHMQHKFVSSNHPSCYVIKLLCKSVAEEAW